MGLGHGDFQNSPFALGNSMPIHTEAAEFQQMLLLAFPNPLHAPVLGSVSASLECDKSFLTGSSAREQSEGINYV